MGTVTLKRRLTGFAVCLVGSFALNLVLHRGQPLPSDFIAKSLIVGCGFFVLWSLSTMKGLRRVA
ncbi:MAG TPA: hypothetical protein VHE55_08720 [Fimbriimonadaceae bacterium]|nr:hypothetical protein [Fimbriimonadaceae bacterium]